jgi:parvulin-like peptidyl-prolyl isomerase
MRAIAVAALGFCVTSTGFAREVIVEIVARVNGDIVTQRDLRREYSAEASGALAECIDRLLALQRAKDLGINVEREVDREIARVQERSGLADPDRFTSFLEKQTGLTLADFRQRIREEKLVGRVIENEVIAGVNIPRSSAQQYYNEHREEFVREERVFLRELLVAAGTTEPGDLLAAEAKAKGLADRARKGESFVELARLHSDHRATALSSGDLTPSARSDLRREIADSVWGKPRGTVTDPIRVEGGYVVLQVTGFHPAGLAPFEDVEPEITEKLIRATLPSRIREYLSGLRRTAYLAIKPGYSDAAGLADKDTSWRDSTEVWAQRVTKVELETEQRRRKRALWIVPMPWTEEESVSRSK